MRSEEIRLNYSNPLANDYLQDFSRVQEFFAYNPYQTESYVARCGYLAGKYPSSTRESVTEVLLEYNTKLGACSETFAAIKLFSQADAVAVVTGQQAGILGGPLYSVYKALTAIQLANKMSKQLNRPVVAIFWIAAEDHDFSEINELHLLDREGQPVKIGLDYRPEGKYSVGNIPVPQNYRELLAEVADLTQNTEFKSSFLGFLEKAAEQSENLADWFGRILLDWLGPLGLIVVNPMDKRLRRLEQELFRAALEHYPRVNNLILQTGGELADRDYPVAVAKDPDNVNLFIYMDKERLTLHGDGDGFRVKSRSQALSKEELMKVIEAEPELFSPNVVLRPLTQDILFPTLAYVGGPGEINYCCQYKGIYELFDMQMPVIFPRANLTLVEGGSENYMKKYEISLPDMVYRSEDIKLKYLESRDEVGIEDIFNGLEKEISEAYAWAISAIKGVDPSLDKLGKENKERVVSQVNWLRSKTLQAHRKANDVFIRQFRKLCNSLTPQGQLQERYLGSAFFVLKYGPSLLHDLAKVDLTSTTLHKVVYLKGM